MADNMDESTKANIEQMNCVIDGMYTELQTKTVIAALYKAQRDEVVGFYNELRQAYYNATGIEFQPTSTIRNRLAPTEEDRAWLRSIGINIDGGAV